MFDLGLTICIVVPILVLLFGPGIFDYCDCRFAPGFWWRIFTTITFLPRVLFFLTIVGPFIFGIGGLFVLGFFGWLLHNDTDHYYNTVKGWYKFWTFTELESE